MDENNRDYTNGEITVYWRPKECIHATTCFRELRAVFNPGKRPWVDMTAATTEEIIRIVDLCPTKALTYKYNKDIPNTNMEEDNSDKTERNNDVEEKVAPAEIRVMPDGPLVIKGSYTIIGEDGKEIKKMKITSLCRCGQSNNMPFCDGMHRKIGWFSR
jgi:uncharacterized Fe-S cluster protein YjdI